MNRFQYLTGLTILFMSFAVISCNKNENKELNFNNCYASNPTNELDWLKECIKDIERWDNEYGYYMTATYKDEPVFYYGNCNPAANYASFVVNCNRDTLGNLYDLSDELTNEKLLWKSEESKCNFDK